MSQIELKIPSLDLNQIDRAKAAIVLSGGAHGWILTNRVDIDEDRDAHLSGLRMFIDIYKAEWQLNIILDKANKVKQMVSDFNLGNLDSYLDDYKKWADNQTPPFDPYKELEYLITTDGIDDLPPKLSLFSELVFFLETYQLRRDSMREAFKQFFGDQVKLQYLAKDEEGNAIMVPEDAIPKAIVQDMRTAQEVRDGLRNIEIGHCLDTYDTWLQAITEMVKNRSPFAEMLPLFK